jgi:hypothetical protein
MVSLVAAAAEVVMRRRALHAARRATRDEQELRRLQAQEGAFRAQVRAGWAGPRNASASCILTQWTDTTGSAAREPPRSMRCATSFPYTAADGIRASAADRLQPIQSADRTVQVHDIPRVSVSP